jgi:membrane protease YdiL (CAAX protease family)
MKVRTLNMKKPNPKAYWRSMISKVKSVGNWLHKIFSPIWNFLKKLVRAIAPAWKNSWVMLLMVLIMAIAQLTLLWRPIVGIYFNAGALAILLGLAVGLERIRQLAISVAIIPVSTMVVLSIPQTTTFARMVVFYDAVLILGLVYRFMFTLEYPLQNTHLKLKEYAFSLSLMAVAGEILGVTSYLMLRHHYVFGTTPLPMVAASVAVFAFAEETLFRGLIQQRAMQVMPPLQAALLPTLLFTFTSISTVTLLAPAFSLLLGAALALAYYQKQNLVLTGTINALVKLTYVGLMASFVFR